MEGLWKHSLFVFVRENYMRYYERRVYIMTIITIGFAAIIASIMTICSVLEEHERKVRMADGWGYGD